MRHDVAPGKYPRVDIKHGRTDTKRSTDEDDPVAKPHTVQVEVGAPPTSLLSTTRRRSAIKAWMMSPAPSRPLHARPVRPALTMSDAMRSHISASTSWATKFTTSCVTGTTQGTRQTSCIKRVYYVNLFRRGCGVWRVDIERNQTPYKLQQSLGATRRRSNSPVESYFRI